MTADSMLSITIHTPSGTAGEAEVMFFALDRARAQFAWKCGGLDAATLRKPHPPSTMTLGGLVKHLAFVETYHSLVHLHGEPMGPPWDTAGAITDHDWPWRTAGDDSPAELYTLWSAAVEHSNEAWRRALEEGGLDLPAKLTTDSDEPVNRRRVLIDLIEEYIRHIGHADLLREAIDGLVGVDPPRPGSSNGTGNE